jgi:hypothetical protein
MKTHDFYNMLEGRVGNRQHLKSGIWEYPDDFLQRYNGCIDKLNALVNLVSHAVEELTVLEKEQMQYTAGSRKTTTRT